MEIQNEKIELENLVFAGTLKLGSNFSLSTYFNPDDSEQKTPVTVLSKPNGELYFSNSSYISYTDLKKTKM